MNEHSENFNKEIENIRKYQTEVTKLKNTPTESWGDSTADSDEANNELLQNRRTELTQTEHKKGNEF